jgi:hypothetical protein
MHGESLAFGFVLRRLAAGIANLRTDRAATVSNVEGVDVARNPHHFSKPAQSVATKSDTRDAMINFADFRFDRLFFVTNSAGLPLTGFFP